MIDMTRDRLHEQTTQQAKEAFKDHVVAEFVAPGRWFLARPAHESHGPEKKWDWAFATEVIADMKFGMLYVGGDTKPVVFRQGPVHPEARVHWMGSRKDANDHYFVEKAVIGSGRDVVEVYHGDIAGDDLKTLQDEIVQEAVVAEDSVSLGHNPDEEHVKKQIEAIEDVKERVYAMSQADLIVEMVELGYDHERVCDFGVVVSNRVYYAHAALARLSELLDQKREKETHGRSTEARTA